jgi:hypothetical protein
MLSRDILSATALDMSDRGTCRRARSQAASTIDRRAAVNQPAHQMLHIARNALHVANLALEQAYMANHLVRPRAVACLLGVRCR